MAKQRNSNYDILDKILSDSQREGAGKVWIPNPHHPDRGYWCDPAEAAAAERQETQRQLDDIERYLRS